MPARAASSALVAGPLAASSLNRPCRSPIAAMIVVIVALTSPNTRPTNASVLAWSTVSTAIASPLLSRLRDPDRRAILPSARGTGHRAAHGCAGRRARRSAPASGLRLREQRPVLGPGRDLGAVAAD